MTPIKLYFIALLFYALNTYEMQYLFFRLHNNNLFLRREGLIVVWNLIDSHLHIYTALN
jgi:hypothetical protein